MQKQVVTILQPFLLFLLSFQKHKAHIMLNMMLDPRFKGSLLVTQYVRNKKVTLIVSMTCMFYFLYWFMHITF